MNMSHPSLLKRLLAALYDGILIIAISFFATALTLPFTKGNVTAENKIYMSLYLLVVIYIFYAWFWTHGGQTLGMRAWKLRLVSINGNAISWQQSFIRFITGLPAWLLFIIGLILWIKTGIAESLTTIPYWLFAVTGFIWVLLDNRSSNWRDKMSGTQVIVTENEK